MKYSKSLCFLTCTFCSLTSLAFSDRDIRSFENRQLIGPLCYKSTVNGALELQIDLPPGSGPFPVVLYVHSFGGTLNQLRQHSYRAAENGIAGVRINYRKFKKGSSWDEAWSDVMAAVHFIFKHADRYNFDTKRFGMVGASAGGLLSSRIAQDFPQCKAYIGLNGMYNLVDREQSRFPSEKILAQMFSEVTRSKLRNASAIYNLNSSPPETLLLHGAEDKVVNANQARLFANAIRDAGGKARVKIFPGEVHGFFNAGKPCFVETAALMIEHWKRCFGRDSDRSEISVRISE